MARQVLILGGGYAGVYAALGGARARGEAPIDITLVSADPGSREPPAPLRARSRPPHPAIRWRPCWTGSVWRFAWRA